MSMGGGPQPTRRRSLWGTRFGFYLAAIGSAFGLGNLWRFPYIAAENGGGAFVLMYTLFALLIGLPLLIGELMLGKLTRRSAIGAMRKLAQGAEPFAGGPRTAGRAAPDRASVWLARAAVVAILVVLSYYAVISGWVLHFSMQFLFSPLRDGGFDPERTMAILRENGLLQVALTSVHLLLTVIVVARGVQEGIEKWVGNLMPLFVVLLFVLVVKSLSLPTAGQALRFLFYPDFSRLSSASMLHALGHVFFTLSVGFGTMVTFGSYLNEGTRIPKAGFRVTAMDTLISLFAGLLVFPLVIGHSGPESAGPEVLFLSLPYLLQSSGGGFFFGVAFFLCLYVAALGASIGLLEAVVSNIMDDRRTPRRLAAWLSGGGVFVLAMFPALSSSVFRDVNVGGQGLLETVDAVLISGVLPLIALGFCLTVAWRLAPERKRAEFVGEDSPSAVRLFGHWLIVTRWIAPAAILIAFALALWGFAVR